MGLVLTWLLAMLLNPAEIVALHYAECYVITTPIGPDTVAVKWVCPR